MLDAVDFNPTLVVVNAIEDSVFAYASPPSRTHLARQLDDAFWSRIVRKPTEHPIEARYNAAWQPA